MKNFKRICAAVLVLVMALGCFAGCHKKNETAVTVGNVKFTSAYYMCALINADSQAKSKVQSSLGSDESKTDIDYYSKKIEKKKFVDWVEDETLSSLKKIAAYKTLCKKADLKIDKDTLSQAESYASYYWTNYGYAQYYEPNGVSQDTYTQYMKDAYYSNLYFEHVYGAEGEKAISAEEVKTATLENFILADKIEISYSNKSEDEISQLSSKANSYVTALQNGTMTFEDVYKDYNGSSDEEEAEEDTEEVKPIDKYASVIGAEDTSYASDYYDDATEMAIGEVKLITLDNNAGLVLLVKKELSADQYYVDNLDLAARHLLKDDEYEKYINKYVKDMKCTVNKYATKRFKVKKIVEPETSSAASTAA